jgi:hypothetical protein
MFCVRIFIDEYLLVVAVEMAGLFGSSLLDVRYLNKIFFILHNRKRKQGTRSRTENIQLNISISLSVKKNLLV